MKNLRILLVQEDPIDKDMILSIRDIEDDARSITALHIRDIDTETHESVFIANDEPSIVNSKLAAENILLTCRAFDTRILVLNTGTGVTAWTCILINNYNRSNPPLKVFVTINNTYKQIC